MVSVSAVLDSGQLTGAMVRKLGISHDIFVGC